jgi:hypothetical protein
MPLDNDLLDKIHETYESKLKAGEPDERKALAEAWGEHVASADIPYVRGDGNDTLDGLGPNTSFAADFVWDAARAGNRAAQKWLCQRFYKPGTTSTPSRQSRVS